jgi:hypothetical protein
MRTFLKNHFLKRAFLIAVFVGWSLASTSVLFARERDWQPQRTWVFVVGTLKWKDSETFQSFPQLNRRDAQLVDFFRREGVPADQLVYLKDEQATIRRVRTEFSQVLSRTREGDFLYVYFTGHGYKSDDEQTTFFATYDAGLAPGWSTRSIVNDINRGFRGSRVLLTADCCFSGALAEDARHLNPNFSYACLTSASSDATSTENWTFTEMFLAGLRGAPYADLNTDGIVTLGEVAENENRDMAFAEDQQTSFSSRGLSAETVLATGQPATNPAIGSRVVVRSEGDWYKARVVDAQGSRLRVHYYGYEESDDEWVLPRQIRGGRELRSAAEGRVLNRHFGVSNGWRETNSTNQSPKTTQSGWLTTPIN